MTQSLFDDSKPLRRVQFAVPGQPVAKGRARSAAVMRGGKALMVNGRPIIKHHTPEKTVIFENLVKMAATQAMAGQPYSTAPGVLVSVEELPLQSA